MDLQENINKKVKKTYYMSAGFAGAEPKPRELEPKQMEGRPKELEPKQNRGEALSAEPEQAGGRPWE